MIHSVSKEMITVIQCVPRIAERTTPATAAQLKVCCCYAPPVPNIPMPMSLPSVTLCVALPKHGACKCVLSDLLLACHADMPHPTARHPKCQLVVNVNLQ